MSERLDQRDEVVGHTAAVPRATYRLQLNRDFTLRQAVHLVPYLHNLGISHVYASPLLKACPGSAHGYDVCDYQELNPELGTVADFEALVQTLRQRQMGLVLDLVPNHMGVSTPENRWWWDVLENGPASRFARFFDIDWNTPDPRSHSKVVVPILGDRYQRVLERQELQLRFEEDKFLLGYFEHRLPICPTTILPLLKRAAARGAAEHLFTIAKARSASTETLRQQLAECGAAVPAVNEAITAAVRELNSRPEALDALLGQQHYRLISWRQGDAELNYRRFFNISSLAGVRMEEERVFQESHRLVLRWLDQGLIDGLRIDHPDGLRDPEGYLLTLQAAAPRTWIVVEKILMPEESLPAWPVAGTTGYDFLNAVGGLFVDPAGEERLTRFYIDFNESSTTYPELLVEKKRLVVRELLAAEVDRLTGILVRICGSHWQIRDFTTPELRQALIEVVAGFPVYRLYARAESDQLSPADTRHVRAAVALARKQCPELDPALFNLLQDLLLLRWRGEAEMEFVLRFQQLTGSTMAKGAEDTAFYCYNRFVALNEVGGDPGRFGVSVESFHDRCAAAQRQHPGSLLATTTHDTKRGEDVRARLYLLSEIPERWRQAVLRWSRMNARHSRQGWSDRNMEYLFYQTAVGAWPLDIPRALAYVEKAGCEAKVYTSWTQRNTEYEAAVRSFVHAALSDAEFAGDLEQFVAGLLDAGWVTSLGQTLLKLTAPGVPDCYQGTELWDLNLVDPDNRRAVDFGVRTKLLEALDRASSEMIWQRRAEGLPKLWLIRQALALRRRRPELFGAEGEYAPLTARGAKAKHVVAFIRGRGAATIVPRLVLGLGGDWSDTVIELLDGQWQNELTGEQVAGGRVLVADLLKRFPVALLSR